MVHHVGVAACTAVHRVRAFSAVKSVVAVVTIEGIVCVVAFDTVIKPVAVSVYDINPREDQVLQVITEGIGERRLNGINALVRIFNDRIACIVYHVGVVAFAAIEGVIAVVTIEGVIACAPFQDIICIVALDTVIEPVAVSVDGLISREGQILHVFTEGIGD